MKKLLTGTIIFAFSSTLAWSQAPQSPAAKANNTWILVITPQTTRHTLDSVVTAWRKESIDMRFSKLKYNNAGLVQVKGMVAIKTPDGHSASATFDSDKLVSIEIKVDDRPGVSVKGK